MDSQVTTFFESVCVFLPFDIVWNTHSSLLFSFSGTCCTYAAMSMYQLAYCTTLAVAHELFSTPEL